MASASEVSFVFFLFSSAASQPADWPLLAKLPMSTERGALRGSLGTEFQWTPASSVDGQQIVDPTIGSEFLEEIENGLGTDLLEHGYYAELAQILRPMFDSLEKNEYGNLQHTGVRYALHRLFVARHGWVIKGLDSAGQHFNSSSPARVFDGKLPPKIQGHFEKLLGGKGFGLKDLVVFGALLEKLISQEAVERLFNVYRKLDFAVDKNVSLASMQVIVDVYTSSFILGVDVFSQTKDELIANKDQMWDIYAAWKDSQAFVRKIRVEVLGDRKAFSFSDLAALMMKFGERFGQWQNFECMNQKKKLMALEDKEKGCVPISNFYKPMLTSDGQDWQFAESVRYLTELGAVDSRDSANMKVMVPNYINAHSNCIATSQFYFICCIDECETLLGHIERQVKGPFADPRELAMIVSNLPSTTELANRSLTPLQMRRLQSIAKKHDGLVPIHGRLFMQWMHMVYPRECSYPHRSGTTNPLTPDQWFTATGQDANASLEEIRQVSSAASVTASIDGQCGRWQDEEELFAAVPTNRRSLRDLESDGHTWAATTSVALLCALASMILAMISALKSLQTSFNKRGKQVHSLMSI
mmetsp:Transcript_1120/g.1645  ORF Transcript_1120/g.1645 Transcript_1120/m.1645 type:complete len:585 (-) Transcript_1120:73-1827(-)